MVMIAPKWSAHTIAWASLDCILVQLTDIWSAVNQLHLIIKQNQLLQTIKKINTHRRFRSALGLFLLKVMQNVLVKEKSLEPVYPKIQFYLDSNVSFTLLPFHISLLFHPVSRWSATSVFVFVSRFVFVFVFVFSLLPLLHPVSRRSAASSLGRKKLGRRRSCAAVYCTHMSYTLCCVQCEVYTQVMAHLLLKCTFCTTWLYTV